MTSRIGIHLFVLENVYWEQLIDFLVYSADVSTGKAREELDEHGVVELTVDVFVSWAGARDTATQNMGEEATKWLKSPKPFFGLSLGSFHNDVGDDEMVGLTFPASLEELYPFIPRGDTAS